MRAITKIFIAATIFLTIKPPVNANSYAQIPLTGEDFHYSPSVMIKSQPDPIIKDTNNGIDTAKNEKSESISYTNFKDSLIDGNAGIVRGIFVEDNFAMKVVQQPSGQASFVSTIDNVITEFSMPKKYGVIGLLAHNYLAGVNFYSLKVNDLMQIIYGDGEVRSYRVIHIMAFQALQPNSARSQFLNLDTGEELSATQMFKLVYTGTHHLTLQTCITQGDIDTWGRLFIVGEPV